MMANGLAQHRFHVDVVTPDDDALGKRLHSGIHYRAHAS